MSIQVRHTFWCEACNGSHDESYHVPAKGVAPQPVLPEGWSKVSGRYYCPRHIATVTVITPHDDLYCPDCRHKHIDEFPWNKVPHKRHKCSNCAHEWTPFNYHSIGVMRRQP